MGNACIDDYDDDRALLITPMPTKHATEPDMDLLAPLTVLLEPVAMLLVYVLETVLIEPLTVLLEHETVLLETVLEATLLETVLEIVVLKLHAISKPKTVDFAMPKPPSVVATMIDSFERARRGGRGG